MKMTRETWNDNYWLYHSISNCLTVEQIEKNIGRKLTDDEQRIYDSEIENAKETMRRGFKISFCPPCDDWDD